MDFHIHPEIFERFPETVIGVVVATSINNSAGKLIEKTLEQAEAKARAKFEGKVLSEHSTIQTWRRAYKQFNAGDYRCSAESITKRILRGDSLPRINALVDLYNAVSLAHTLPIGGEDLAAVTGDIHLTLAEGTEEFIRLGSDQNEPPELGEIIYRDEKTVLCRKWNWRESDLTKLTEDTERAIFFIESLSNESAEVLAATTEYAKLIQEFCGAKTEIKILTKADHDFRVKQ